MNHDQFLHPIGQNNSWERLGRSRLKATEVGSLRESKSVIENRCLIYLQFFYLKAPKQCMVPDYPSIQIK